MISREKASLRIFISHSHKDNDFGLQLVNDLRNAIGSEEAVWYDVSGGLHGGDAWWRKIVTEITMRSIFLIVLSPDSMNSDWVNDEIDLAWQQKNSLSGKVIIPLVYRACDIRADLNTRQIISFLPPRDYNDAFNQLLQALGIPKNQPKITASSIPSDSIAKTNEEKRGTDDTSHISNEINTPATSLSIKLHPESVVAETTQLENVPPIKKRFPITGIFTNPAYVPIMTTPTKEKVTRVKTPREQRLKSISDKTQKPSRYPLLIGLMAGILLIAAFSLVLIKGGNSNALSITASTKTATSRFATLTATTVKGDALSSIATENAFATTTTNSEYKVTTPDCGQDQGWSDNSGALANNSSIQCLPGDSVKLSYGGGQCTDTNNTTYLCEGPDISYRGINGSLPLSFTASFEIDNLSSQGCINLNVDQGNFPIGSPYAIYSLGLCQDGSWNYGISSTSTSSINLPNPSTKSGSTRPANIYDLTFAISATNKTILLNGSNLANIPFTTPSSFNKTDDITIYLGSNGAKLTQVVTASIKNFDFIPHY